MKSETFVCTACGEVFDTSELYEVNGDYLCSSCADELTVVCEHCGDRIYDNSSVSDDNTILCQRCYDDYYLTCSDCGRIIQNSAAYYFDDGSDDPLCSRCYDERDYNCSIHEYSYMPELVFHGKGNRYFGVELEVDGAGKKNGNADQILTIANQDNENLYIKSDGSLDAGLELVTHPMTLEYHLQQMPWDAVLKKTLSLGYLSHRTTTCGLHVHVSRNAFGCTVDQQEENIARLLFFVEKFWPELLRFSRRSENQIRRWAARYGMKLCPKEVLDHAKNSCAGRYTAVNLTNCDTVEIRIFRGTLKLNTLIATLQMVNAMCDVAISLSDEELQAMSWHDFLDRIQEVELIQYLKERSLYKNDPVTEQMEDE